MVRSGVAIGVLLLITSLSGCSKNAETLSHAEYVNRVNTICTESSRRSLELASKRTRRGSGYSRLEVDQLLHDTLESLRALSPPPALRSRTQAWLDALELELSASLVLRLNAGNGSYGDADRIALRLVKASRRATSLATTLGLIRCTGSSIISTGR